MGKKQDLSPRKKGQLRVLLEETTLTQQQIALKLGISQSAVCVYVKRLKKTQTVSPRRVGRCGRKRVSSARADRKLVQLCVKSRRSSSGVLRHQWAETGVQASARTVRRRLFDAGLKSRRAKKKPLLTAAMKKSRMLWAKKYEHWTSVDWAKVVFSDESTIQILDDRTTRVRRRIGEENQDDCTVKTVKHPAGIMVWGAISVRGHGRLHIVEGTMRQDQYVNVLRTRLIPQLQQWFTAEERNLVIFQHDKAPCHMAKTVQQFLRNSGIRSLDWPGNSADMNPI